MLVPLVGIGCFLSVVDALIAISGLWTTF